MNVSRSRLLTLLAALLLSSASAARPALAQDPGGGSIYSRFGLGELRAFSSSQAAAMGGGGTALRSLNYLNLANPAGWSDQVLTRAAAGVSYRTIEATDARGESSRLQAGTLDFVQFSFPLYSRKLGVGLAYQPYSRSNYLVRSAGTTPALAQPDSLVGYQVDYEGRGGLQQITGGLGYRVSDALSVGARVDVIFGILEEGRRTTFDDFRYTATNRTDATRLAGVTGTFGGLLSLASVLTGGDVLSLGATFTLPTTLTGERTRTLGVSNELNRDTLSVTDGSVDVPLGASVGLTYKPDARWTVLADGLYEPWSNFKNSFAPSPGGRAVGDRLRASLGAELLPAGEDLNDPFFQRTAYRLGGYYEQSYARAGTGGQAINTLAATGGISLPAQLAGTRLDINVEVGTRGTTENDLVRDFFYRFSLNVNFGERWFRERKLR